MSLLHTTVHSTRHCIATRWWHSDDDEGHSKRTADIFHLCCFFSRKWNVRVPKNRPRARKECFTFDEISDIGEWKWKRRIEVKFNLKMTWQHEDMTSLPVIWGSFEKNVSTGLSLKIQGLFKGLQGVSNHVIWVEPFDYAMHFWKGCFYSKSFLKLFFPFGENSPFRFQPIAERLVA